MLVLVQQSAISAVQLASCGICSFRAVKIYVRPAQNYSAPVRYSLKLVEQSCASKFEWVAQADDADLIFCSEHAESQPIASPFYQGLSQPEELKHSKWLLNITKGIVDEEGTPDVLATIFYLVNALQEHAFSADEHDDLGRVRYSSTYQHAHNCVEQNLVQPLIDTLLNRWGLQKKTWKSRLFLSHDIDTINGAWIQDGFWALKQGKFGLLASLLFRHMLGKPDWRNMDKMMRIHDEHDLKSTFFWLVEQQKGNLGIKNADYAIRKQDTLLKSIASNGFVNGLHKAQNSHSLQIELDRSAFLQPLNRYHFFIHTPRRDWTLISKSEIQLDSSLLFVERMGFRNSYGRAFQPFDLQEQKPFDFVEVPLQIMDSSLFHYMNIPRKGVGKTVIDFWEKNAENCHLSLLWHNTSFSDYKYKGLLPAYLQILDFARENNLQHILPEELIKDNRLIW